MNIFSNNEQQSIANLTESILFNITVNNNNNLISLENNNLTLVCQYFNETTKELSSDGVFVNRIININNNETIIECGTSHLTDFVIVKTSTTKKNIIPVVSSGNSGNNPPREISGKKTVIYSPKSLGYKLYLFTKENELYYLKPKLNNKQEIGKVNNDWNLPYLSIYPANKFDVILNSNYCLDGIESNEIKRMIDLLFKQIKVAIDNPFVDITIYLQ
ncbi:hypothetical protein ABK040_013010 [Willaertia magna]